MLKQRVLTAVIGLPVVLILLYLGGIPFLILLFLASELAYFEYMRCIGRAKSPLYAAGAAEDALCFVLLPFLGTEALILCSVLFLITAAALLTVRYGEITADEVRDAVFGFLYTCVLLGLFVLLRNRPGGLYEVLFALAAAWGSDTAAYFAGRAFGKHKMAPQLSPKKTWEGFAGGILGAAVLGILLALIFRGKLSHLPAPVLTASLVTAVSSVAGVVGDLFASAIKRHYGVKDYGTIFPGHGGIMDRIDSVLFTVPVVYFAFELLEKLV